jgi:hypothetical protein
LDKRHHVAARRDPCVSEVGSEERPGPRPKVVNEDRAAALLGVSAEKLRRLSSETGLGRAEYEEGQEQVVFTYAELYRLCRSAVQVGGD